MSQNHPNETLHGDDTREDNAQADVQQLAEAPLCNPSDALEILARTSPSNRSDYSDLDEDGEADRDIDHAQLKGDEHAELVNVNLPTPNKHSSKGHVVQRASLAEGTDYRQDLKLINSFPLIKLGLIKPTQLRTYVSVYISRHNHYLPIIPEHRLPNTDHRLGQYVTEETFLLMVIVLIVSRYDKDSAHSSCWKFIRCHLSGITLRRSANSRCC